MAFSNRPITKSEINNMGILTKFLSRIEDKTRKTQSTFYQDIEENEEKLTNCFLSNPYFAEILLYQDKKENKRPRKPKIIIKNKRNNRAACQIINTPNQQSFNKTNTIKSMSLPKLQSTQKKLRESSQYFETTDNEKSKQSLQYSKSTRRIMNTTWLNRYYQGLIIDLNTSNEETATQPTIISLIINTIKSVIENSLNPSIAIPGTATATSTKINFTFKETERNQLRQRNRFQNLYLKCNSEISRGESLDVYLEKSREKFSKKIDEIKEEKRKLSNNKDIAIISQIPSKKTKYHILQQINIAKNKKSFNKILSESLAYHNRAQIMKEMKESQNNPYYLYLSDLNKKEALQKLQREKENRQLVLINTILEDTYKDKECLKMKIEEQDEKNRKEFNKGKCESRNRKKIMLGKSLSHHDLFSGQRQNNTAYRSFYKKDKN